MDIEAVVKLVVLLGLIGKTGYDVVTRPPRPLAWAMFGHAMFCRIDAWVTDAAGKRRRFNQWEHIANLDLRMDLFRLDNFLAFLEDEHGLAPTGTATLINDDREIRLHIVDGVLEG